MTVKDYAMHFLELHMERCDSTNAELSRMEARGEDRGDLMLRTDYQQHGKGQGDHGWYSSPDKNLLVSFLLHPAFLSASRQFAISQAASLALCDLLSSLSLEARIKWPNDILIGGRKVAGILIEHGLRGPDLKHSIIGIGLNVNEEIFPEFPREATSLRLEGKRDRSPEEVGLQLRDALALRYAELQSGAFRQIDASYCRLLYGLDRPMRFLINSMEITATIRGVNEFGQLLLEEGRKMHICDMQDLRFLDTPATGN